MDKYLNQVSKKIIEHPEYQKRKKYRHHAEITVYEHSIKVTEVAYKISKVFKIKNKEDIIIASLLHDFYLTPWQENKEKKKFFKKHGFTHAEEAKNNAKKYFPELMNKRVENAIARHMFPLNIKPPKYKEGWIVTISDKIVSMEVFLHPSFFKRLVGIRGKNNE